MLDEVFNYAVNISGVNQGFYDRFGDVHWVPAYCAVDRSQFVGNYNRVLRDVGSFLDELSARNVREFYIRRTFATGDVLMLVPLIRHLRCLGYDPFLMTKARYLDVLRLLGVRSFPYERSLGANVGGYGIWLDGTVEQDHVRPRLQKFHRIEIYSQALGLKKLPKELDWSCNTGRFPIPQSEFYEEPYVVFQGGGSTFRKRLPAQTVLALIKRLNNEGVKILYIGDPIQLKSVDRRMTKLQFYAESLPELFSWIAKARCLITMDSGPLWISHFTQTPVVAIFGPTRPETRVTFHPLYPERVKVLRLNREINCPACHEHSVRCKDNITCLKLDPKKLFALLKPMVMQFWRI